MRIVDRFPVTFLALAVLIVVLNFSYGVANAGQQPSAKPEAKATPTPTPDPLAFTAAEQGEVRTILADQKQIGERLRKLDDELTGINEDDEKGFALVGIKRQKQLEKLRASEQQGAKFIEKVKPRCVDCVFDFDKMRLVKPPNADTAINASTSSVNK